MISIKFGRYVPTLDTRVDQEGRAYNLFESKIDHELNQTDSQIDLKRALVISKKWLDHHFGFVVIYLGNTDEEDSDHIVRLCNYKKFVAEMIKNNIFIKLVSHIKN